MAGPPLGSRSGQPFLAEGCLRAEQGQEKNQFLTDCLSPPESWAALHCRGVFGKGRFPHEGRLLEGIMECLAPVAGRIRAERQIVDVRPELRIELVWLSDVDEYVRRLSTRSGVIERSNPRGLETDFGLEVVERSRGPCGEGGYGDSIARRMR